MRFSSFIYLVGQGLHSMKANRLMTFASMGVLTVCMILVGTAFLFGVNIDAVVQYMGSQNESYVSVSDDATEEQINALGDQIGAADEVAVDAGRRFVRARHAGGACEGPPRSRARAARRDRRSVSRSAEAERGDGLVPRRRVPDAGVVGGGSTLRAFPHVGVPLRPRNADAQGSADRCRARNRITLRIR